MATNPNLDAIDLTILRTLQKSSRTANAEIARQLGMAPSAVLERIRKLEARGVIQSYEARLDPATLGLPLLAFVFVRAEEPVGNMTTGDLLAELPNVLEVHHVAGEDCYLVKVRAADTAALSELLRDGLGSIPTVGTTKSTIVLDTLKETARLTVPT